MASIDDVDLVLYEEGDVLEYGVSCYGADDGMINLLVEGGVGNYSYILESFEGTRCYHTLSLVEKLYQVLIHQLISTVDFL